MLFSCEAVRISSPAFYKDPPLHESHFRSPADVELLGCSAIFVGTARRRTPETGVYFTQPPRQNPAARVLVPRSGMTKQNKRTFKAPAHLTQHRAAARRSAPPHDDPSPTGRTPRHGPGIRPPEGRHVPSTHIRARLAPVLYRSSFVVVVSGQWCARTSIRVTTPVSSLLKLRLLV